jgi:anthraniloyl-CoA monooxygenase
MPAAMVRPRKLHVVGGGPAGLYFAILCKQRAPECDVHVWERNPADNTFGWGVVFSGRTLSFLAETDPEVHRRLMACAETWEDVEVVRPDGRVRIGGNPYCGVARIALLRILQERARGLGVRLAHGRAVEDPADLAGDADLLVGADGVGSVVRQRWKERFGPQIEYGANAYIWLGTPQRFDALTLTFRPRAEGLYIAHSYRFEPGMSTFIVETPAATLAAAGLDRLSEADMLRHLEGVFAEDLAGAPLRSNQSRWIRFVLIRTARWQDGNVVLLGDACHTAHFSIGSGTKLAMEDAAALARALTEECTLEAALAAYEALRRPKVEDFQEAARRSRIWFETAHEKMGLDLDMFALDMMMRSGRVTMEELERRDPAFVSRIRHRLPRG